MCHESTVLPFNAIVRGHMLNDRDVLNALLVLLGIAILFGVLLLYRFAA